MNFQPFFPLSKTATAPFDLGRQSSTFTGTLAGQVIMEGFLNLKIPCCRPRLVTRLPALAAGL